MTRWIITLLGCFGRIVAACRTCPGADAAHDRRQRPTCRRSSPCGLKTVDPAASKYQFRLGDGEVDLLKAFSLDGSDGIGSAWKVPSVGKFQERFGRW